MCETTTKLLRLSIGGSRLCQIAKSQPRMAEHTYIYIVVNLPLIAYRCRFVGNVFQFSSDSFQEAYNSPALSYTMCFYNKTFDGYSLLFTP